MVPELSTDFTSLAITYVSAVIVHWKLLTASLLMIPFYFFTLYTILRSFQECWSGTSLLDCRLVHKCLCFDEKIWRWYVKYIFPQSIYLLVDYFCKEYRRYKRIASCFRTCPLRESLIIDYWWFILLSCLFLHVCMNCAAP